MFCYFECFVFSLFFMSQLNVLAEFLVALSSLIFQVTTRCPAILSNISVVKFALLFTESRPLPLTR